jgi:hypothetical protein
MISKKIMARIFAILAIVVLTVSMGACGVQKSRPKKSGGCNCGF